MSPRGLAKNLCLFRYQKREASLEHDVVHRAYSLGVADYIQRPISPYIAQRRIENIIDLFKTRAAYKKLLEINRTLLERLSEVDDSITDVRNP